MRNNFYIKNKDEKDKTVSEKEMEFIDQELEKIEDFLEETESIKKGRGRRVATGIIILIIAIACGSIAKNGVDGHGNSFLGFLILWVVSISVGYFLDKLTRLFFDKNKVKKLSIETEGEEKTQLTTREKLDTAFKKPEFAKDLYLHLVKVGQIPIEKGMETEEEIDRFFGVKRPLDKDKIQGLIIETIEEGKRISAE